MSSTIRTCLSQMLISISFIFILFGFRYVDGAVNPTGEFEIIDLEDDESVNVFIVSQFVK